MNKKVHRQFFSLTRRDFLQNTTLALCGLAGAGRPAMLRAGSDAILRIRGYQDVFSLDPVSTVSGAEGIINTTIFQNLLQFKANGSWDTQYDAAEAFEQIDPTRYRFRLKPGQVFNNGFGELTADDVKFSFERMVDPAMHAVNLPDMGPLSHVEVHDRYAGTLVLRSPYAAFIPVAVAGPSGVLLSRKAVEAGGGRFNTNPPCSSGPYAFKSWQAQRKTVLQRNPAWTGEQAAFAEIHIYPISDDKAAEMAYEAGQLDCTQISVESVAPFRRNMPPASSLQVLPSGRNIWLGMNRENPALADIRIRRAIQYAIDVEAVLEAAWFGLAKVSTGPIPAGMTGHREHALIPPAGDPGRARALLRETGISLPLRLRLDVPSRSRDLTAVQVMQWSLKKVGIEVDIKAQDNSTYIMLGRQDLGDQWRDIQLYLGDFIGMADPYYSVTWFDSDQIGLWNWERFNNAEFDQLNERALEVTGAEERGAMYRRMEDLMEASGCYRFVTNGVMPNIFRDSIEPAFRPDGYPMLRDFRPSVGTA
ncbi:MAG: ABC transporter substrate-binding protein [Lysobacterales bacterium]